MGIQLVSAPQPHAVSWYRTLEVPLASANLSTDTTIMLEKAYADVNRMVFVVFIKSPQEGLLASSALLKDTTGVELNTGFSISSPPDNQPTS